VKFSQAVLSDIVFTEFKYTITHGRRQPENMMRSADNCRRKHEKVKN